MGMHFCIAKKFCSLRSAGFLPFELAQYDRIHRELFTYFVHDLIRYDYGNNKLFEMNSSPPPLFISFSLSPTLARFALCERAQVCLTRQRRQLKTQFYIERRYS